jgi:rhodanese-related sulfurtransferase
MQYLSNFGSTAMVIGLCVLGIYIFWRAWRRWRAARLMASLPRVHPHELAELIATGRDLVIVDVRAALGQQSLDQGIPGARHIDLGTMETVAIDSWPANAHVIAYCACPNDASALKAAHLLAKRGLVVSVLKGGFDGWTAAGQPVEAIRCIVEP